MIVQKCLQEGEELGETSIAFPVIGTGKLSFPRSDASRIMLEETIRFCHDNPLYTLREIRFVVYQQDQALVNAFGQEMAKLVLQKLLSYKGGSQLGIIKDTGLFFFYLGKDRNETVVTILKLCS